MSPLRYMRRHRYLVYCFAGIEKMLEAHPDMELIQDMLHLRRYLPLQRAQPGAPIRQNRDLGFLVHS